MAKRLIQTRDEMAEDARRSIEKAVEDARYGLEVALVEDAPFWLAHAVEDVCDAAARGARIDALLPVLDEVARLAKRVRLK